MGRTSDSHIAGTSGGVLEVGLARYRLVMVVGGQGAMSRSHCRIKSVKGRDRRQLRMHEPTAVTRVFYGFSGLNSHGRTYCSPRSLLIWLNLGSIRLQVHHNGHTKNGMPGQQGSYCRQRKDHLIFSRNATRQE